MSNHALLYPSNGGSYYEDETRIVACACGADNRAGYDVFGKLSRGVFQQGQQLLFHKKTGHLCAHRRGGHDRSVVCGLSPLP